MTTKTPEYQYRATMARNGRKSAGSVSERRRKALERGMEKSNEVICDQNGSERDSQN